MTQLGEQLAGIFHIRNEGGIHVAFTSGIDGTVIVKSYQVSFSNGVVVGVAHPNNYLSIEEVRLRGLNSFEVMHGWNTWATCVRD